MAGFNLPPGCSVSDIPGNRPEDAKAEAIYDAIYEIELKAREAHPDIGDSYVEALAEAIYSMVTNSWQDGYSESYREAREAEQLKEIEDAAKEYHEMEALAPNDARRVEYDERNEILSYVEHADPEPMDKRANAFIYKDGAGRLCILPHSGGWLGVDPKDFKHLRADIAPFHG